MNMEDKQTRERIELTERTKLARLRRKYRKRDDDALYECQNTASGPMSSLGCQLYKVESMLDRIAPGEQVPAGECPECRALAALV
jgi:hypothetical protein